MTDEDLELAAAAAAAAAVPDPPVKIEPKVNEMENGGPALPVNSF